MEKSKGKEGSLVAVKEREVDAKHSPGNGICGCLEEITKLAYIALSPQRTRERSWALQF